MPKVPLPKKNTPGADPSETSDYMGSKMINIYRDNIFGISVLRKRPGTYLFSDLNSTYKIDGLYWWDEKSVALAVSNGKIYKILSRDGDYTLLAGDTLNSGTITNFACTGSTVIMANGGKMISYDNSTNPAYIADVNAPTTVSHVGYIDKLMIANKIGTGEFYESQVNDFTTWTPVIYYEAETQPDNVTAFLVNGRELLLFGPNSVETWTNTETGFSRIDARCFSIGCIAPYSVANLGGVIIWLGASPFGSRDVFVLDGGNIFPITGIDLAPILSTLSPAEEAYSVVFKFKDKTFYVLSFTVEKRSFVYDVMEKEWFEWAGWNTTTASYDIFPARCCTYAKAWNLLLVGDTSSGKVMKIEPGVFQDSLKPIRSLIETGHISYGTLSRKRSSRLHIKAAGAAPSGSNPFYSLSWNDDRKGFGNSIVLPLSKEGETSSIGPMGNYETRQYRIEHSDNSDFILLDMEESIAGAR